MASFDRLCGKRGAVIAIDGRRAGAGLSAERRRPASIIPTLDPIGGSRVKTERERRCPASRPPDVAESV